MQSDKGIQDFHQHGNFAVLLLPVAVIEIFTDIIFNYYIVPLRCRSHLVSEIETEADVRGHEVVLSTLLFSVLGLQIEEASTNQFPCYVVAVCTSLHGVYFIEPNIAPLMKVFMSVRSQRTHRCGKCNTESMKQLGLLTLKAQLYVLLSQ